MECNIDDRGARVRRIWGTLNLLAGAVLGVLAWLTGPWWLALIGVGCIAGGLFAFYEARKKWCVVRAMGIKTPM